MVVRFQPITNIFDEIETMINSNVMPLSAVRRPVNGTRFAEIAVKEAGDQVQVFVHVPGIAKEDVGVQLNNNTLTITAERKEPEMKENEQWIRNEVKYGKFERTVQLPYSVDTEKVAATQENGILRIVLPKHESARPKQISIR